MVFNQSSERRTAILDDLSLHGMDVTYPKTLSSQIDAQHAELENALLQNKDGRLLSINSGLRLLKQQFQTTVVGYQMDLQAQLKVADSTI
jgi:Mor family transcriptional regulator